MTTRHATYPVKATITVEHEGKNLTVDIEGEVAPFVGIAGPDDRDLVQVYKTTVDGKNFDLSDTETEDAAEALLKAY